MTIISSSTTGLTPARWRKPNIFSKKKSGVKILGCPCWASKILCWGYKIQIQNLLMAKLVKKMQYISRKTFFLQKKECHVLTGNILWQISRNAQFGKKKHRRSQILCFTQNSEPKSSIRAILYYPLSAIGDPDQCIIYIFFGIPFLKHQNIHSQFCSSSVSLNSLRLCKIGPN